MPTDCISLKDLSPASAYNVMRDARNHESIVVSGRSLLQRIHSSDFQKFRDDESMPMGHGGYIRVRIEENKSVAVWRDPTRPELTAAQLEQIPTVHERPHLEVVEVDEVEDKLISAASQVRRILAK